MVQWAGTKKGVMVMQRIHPAMRVFRCPAMSILLGLAIGCGREYAAVSGADKAKEEQLASPNANEPGSKTARSKAIKAAKAHLKAQGGLTGSYDVDATANENGEWDVFFKFRPAVPGGHCSVIVDKNGTVLGVWPGL